MARPGDGSWNGIVMSDFSAKRRILSLWLPRLPIDRIKRTLQSDGGERADNSIARIEDNSCDTDGRLSPPLRGRAGEGGSHERRSSWPPPSLTSRASSARLGPRKGGGNETELFDIPSVVVIKEHNALVIYSLDDAAARYGLTVGLPLANARAICPHLEVHDADPAADAKTLDDIADWCDRFTPLVALDAPHGLFLDITGCAHLFGGEAKILRQLCDALTAQGFAVSAAIASTSVCARTMKIGRAHV